MLPTVNIGDVFKHRTLVETGPANGPQRPNRFTVIDLAPLEGGYVVRWDGGPPSELPTTWGVSTFHKTFELLTPAPVPAPATADQLPEL